MRKYLSTLIKSYYISSTTIGGLYAYLEYCKELESNNILPFIIIYAGVSPYIPFMYTYNKLSGRENIFNINYKIKKN